MRWLGWLVALVLLVAGPAAGQLLDIPEAGQGRLKAQRVRYDRRTQTFYAEGDVRLSIGDLQVDAPQLRVDQRRREVYATGGVLVRQRGSVLRARELTYEIGPRLAHVTGSVVFEQEGTTVTAGQMTLNLAAQEVRTRDGVRLVREGTTLTGDEMVADMSTRVVEVTGHAVLVRPAGAPPASQDRAARALASQETKVTADRIRFQWDVHEAEAAGSVVVTQPDKSARAARMVYSEARGMLELAGGVELEQRSGEWLVEGGVVQRPRDAEGAKALATPVRLWADRLVVRLETKDMQADGRVKIAQEGRVATGDRAVYTERDRTIVVTGNVRLQEADGSWLRADKVIVAIDEETFEASGNVETEFTVTRGK